VGGRDRHAEVRGQGQDGGRAGLRGEAVDRVQLDHLVAQGLDDLPAARGGTGGHHHRAGAAAGVVASNATKVEINQQGEKGKIIIEYYSSEELNRVLEFFFTEE